MFLLSLGPKGLGIDPIFCRRRGADTPILAESLERTENAGWPPTSIACPYFWEIRNWLGRSERAQLQDEFAIILQSSSSRADRSVSVGLSHTAAGPAPPWLVVFLNAQNREPSGATAMASTLGPLK